MITTAPIRHPLLRLGAATLVLSLAAALSTLGAGAASAAPRAGAPATPQLSIAVTDARASATTGDRLAYTMTIRNLGRTALTRLSATQSVPAGLRVVSVVPQSKVVTGNLHWSLGLKAGATATMRTTMTLGRTPRSLLRLAVVSCTAKTADGPPIVCASDSDQLPAGAANAHQEAKAAASRGAADAGSSGVIWWSVGGGVALCLLVAGAVVTRRRRSSSRHAHAQGHPASV